MAKYHPTTLWPVPGIYLGAALFHPYTYYAYQRLFFLFHETTKERETFENFVTYAVSRLCSFFSNGENLTYVV